MIYPQDFSFQYEALFNPYARWEHRDDNDTKVVIAQGLHLFPSRTEKLNLATPMILRKWESR